MLNQVDWFIALIVKFQLTVQFQSPMPTDPFHWQFVSSFQCSFRAISEQFRGNFRAVFNSQPIHSTGKSSLAFSAISEQFQSNFRAVPVQFQCSLQSIPLAVSEGIAVFQCSF